MYLSVYQAVDQWTGNMEPHTFTTRVFPGPFKFFDVVVQSLILMDQFFLVDYPMIVVSYSHNRRLLQNLGSTEPSGIFRQLRLSISVTSSASKLQQPPLFTNLPEVGCINMYKAFPMCWNLKIFTFWGSRIRKIIIIMFQYHFPETLNVHFRVNLRFHESPGSTDGCRPAG